MQLRASYFFYKYFYLQARARITFKNKSPPPPSQLPAEKSVSVQDGGNIYVRCFVPGDVNLGAGQVLVVLEGGQLLGVPECDGPHHVPAHQVVVSIYYSTVCTLTLLHIILRSV